MTVMEATALRRESRRRKVEASSPSQKLLVERGADGQLSVLKDGVRTSVRVCRCFPWSEPGRFISLRDEKENEVALIEQLGELEPASRTAVELALAEAGF